MAGQHYTRIRRSQSVQDDPIPSSVVLPRPFTPNVVSAEPEAVVQARLERAKQPSSLLTNLTIFAPESSGNRSSPMLQADLMQGMMSVQHRGLSNSAPGTLGIQRDDDPVKPKIKSEDIEYEIIAHRLAYQGQNGIPGAFKAWLDERGYAQDWAGTVSGPGLFVGLLMPKADSNRTPILAFKGTEPSKAMDIMADVDPVSVGFTAFKMQRAEIAALIAQAGGKVDTTGHSLGGALAQQAASTFPSLIRRVVTFQAPGLSRMQASLLDKQAERPEATHHIATGDIVDLAGGRHMTGDFFLHQVAGSLGGGPGTHTQYLLNSDHFKAEREAVGLTDDRLEAMGVADKKAQHTGNVKQSGAYPFYIRQFFAERGRELAIPLGMLAAGAIGAKKGITAAGGMVASGAKTAGKALWSGAKTAGNAIATGAQAVGGAIASGASTVGGAIASGASSLAKATRNLFKRKQKNE